MKTLKNILLTTLPSVIVLLILLEVFFRTVIRADDPPRSMYDVQEQMFYFSNKKETGITTRGRFAEIRAKWRINNMHWNYPTDYYPRQDKKLIAVIGDSYIEAFQVDTDKKYPFLLGNMLKNDYDVYAFGISGAPLSQYLNISRYVRRHFNPDIIIINTVHNDFDESINQLNPGNNWFLKVSLNEDGSITETIPQPKMDLPQYKPWKRLLYKSALFRYVYLNLCIKEIPHQLTAHSKNKFEANVKLDEVNVNKESIYRSTDFIIKTISSENRDTRIIFLLDGLRGNIYEKSLDKSELAWMGNMMADACKNSKVEFLDLTPGMEQDFVRNNKRFESANDWHWNEYGHQFVAEVLYKYLSASNN